MVLAVVVAASSVVVFSASPAHAAQPVIGGAGTFPYLENDPPITVGTGITVAGGGSYAGQYVQFGVSGASPWEVLHLPTDASASIANGVVSIVGANVWLGNGVNAQQIGAVDAILDGTAGKVLRVNFSSTFQNPGFETADMSSWTAINNRIDLGVTSIASCPTVDTNTYPGNTSGRQDNSVPTALGQYSSTVDSTYHSSGAYSLRLLSTNITTALGYDVVHGPAVYSSTFDANAGDVIDFDWQARSGQDAEDVFGYIINTATCAQTVVLDHTGASDTGSTTWATVSTNIPATGTYRFVFVSGTYDFTGGRLAGASLYIDNMRVYGTQASDAVVQQISNRLTYSNSTYDLPAARTIVLSAKSAGGETASTNITVNIEPQPEAPVYLDDTLGVFHFNQSYSDAVTTRAWPLANYALTGATPTGVTFDTATATFTGTPTVADETYDFTVIAQNIVGNTQRHYSGTVQSPPTLFTDSDTGVFVLDRTHNNTIAANGFPAPSYALTGGALPAGITFNPATRAFTGTPTQGLAPYSFTITATNIEGSLPHVFSGTVETEPTLYTDSDIGQFVVGTPHNNGVHADGLQTPTYAVTSGILPPGLFLNSTTGVITGTPTTTGPYGFWITASNAHGSISLHLVGVVSSVPAFTDSTLANFSTDDVYTDDVSASGYPAATYSITTGALPAGITLDLTTGAVTGTPTGVEAPYSFTITATNVGGFVSVLYTGTVRTEPRAFTDGTLPQFIQGTAVVDGVTANGFPAPTYTITSGSLPGPLTLNLNTGAVTGTPAATGPYSFQITATNSEGSLAKTFSGEVASTPAFTDSTIATFSTDDVYIDDVSASGYPAPTYTVSSGFLPAGITLNANSGNLTGSPTGVEAPYSFTIRASNLGGFVSVPYSGTVNTEPRVWTDQTIVQLVIDVPVIDDVSASGFPAPTYTITDGDLPTGLNLNLNTGAITGTPTVGGPYSFEVTAANSQGTLATTLTGGVAYEPAFIDSTLADFITDNVYTDEVSANGYPAATYSITDGALPAGVTLNMTTGELTGTPTGVEAPYSFEITASNSYGDVSEEFSGTVNTEPRAWTDDTLEQFVIDTLVVDGVSANGFPAPTYTITDGDLPDGLVLDFFTGEITGTPTLGEAYSFEVTANNGHGILALTFTGTVAFAPTFTDILLADFITDNVYTDGVSATGYPAATYSITEGALPAGVTLNLTTGALTGTPTDVEAPYSFEITATNSVGSDWLIFSGTVNTEPRAWTDDTLVQFVIGTAVVDGVSANGFPAPTYTITDGDLPAGLVLNFFTGAITGTPTVGEAYSFEVTASNIQGELVLTFTGTVAYAPSFTDSTLADFSTDDVYTDEVSADGFPAATYTVSAGTLPAGVTLNPTTGELTGTPTGIEAPYSFEITASNFVGSDSVTFTGTVHTGPRSFTDGEIQELVIGSSVTDGVTANGFPAPTYSITSGSLPAGLTLDPTTGAITGTPTVPGLYSFEVTATNSQGSIATTLAGRVYREDRGYLGLNPGRLFDSRDTNTPVEAGSVTEVTVIGRFGVPLDARAAVLNVTVTDAGADGFATVYPCGSERQLVSNLNFVTGETVSNSVTTVLGTDGKICVFTTAGTHLVVDVNGAFSPTQGLGQLLPLAPSRLFDSRDSNTLLAAGSITELEVTNHGGVPANAGAAVLNVTVTGPIGAGYVTVYPCGSERPLASNVNFLAGKTVPRAVIAAVGEQGRVCVFTSAATHLVVDINGAFSLDGEGRFQGITPHRLLDTREGSKPAAGAIQVLTIGGQGSIPANTMAVVLNVTLTESDTAGFATVYPCEAAIPLASNVNFVPGQTVPNAVTASLDSLGQVCVFANAGAHVVVDIYGIYIP